MNEANAATDMLDKAWALAKRFEAARIPYSFKIYRFDAVSILAESPGEYWEIDFLDDGSVDVEIFKAHGLVEDPLAAIEELIRRDSEPTQAVVELNRKEP